MRGPLALRLALLLPVIGLFAFACREPALFLDSGGKQHGDSPGPGRGTLSGMACLLFGWLPDNLSIGWYANPALLAAILLFAFARYGPASLAALLASALGTVTPQLLPYQTSHPLAYPMAGYYWWQSCLILMQTLTCTFGSRSRTVRAVEIAMIAGAVTVVSLQPAVFREREAQTSFRISGRMVLPPKADPNKIKFELTIPEAHLDVYPGPLLFTSYHQDLKIAPDGRFALNSRLPVLGQPKVVEVLLDSEYFLPFHATHPLTRKGNLYQADLPDAVVTGLSLRRLTGPVTFEHPTLDYTIDVPKGWELIPEGQGPGLSLSGPQQVEIRISNIPRRQPDDDLAPWSYSHTESVKRKHPRGHDLMEYTMRWKTKAGRHVRCLQINRISPRSLEIQGKVIGSTAEECEQRFQPVQAVLDTFR